MNNSLEPIVSIKQPAHVRKKDWEILKSMEIRHLIFKSNMEMDSNTVERRCSQLSKEFWESFEWQNDFNSRDPSYDFPTDEKDVRRYSLKRKRISISVFNWFTAPPVCLNTIETWYFLGGVKLGKIMELSRYGPRLNELLCVINQPPVLQCRITLMIDHNRITASRDYI